MTHIKKHYDDHERQFFNTVGISMTHQSMAAECDINKIMLKWQKTGILEHRNTFEGQYGDFTETPQDYHESMNAVLAAEDMFSTLPSQIRKRFANDPGLFLEFVSDPENAAEMVSLGLATAPQIAESELSLVEPLDDALDTPKTASKPPSKPEKTPS